MVGSYHIEMGAIEWLPAWDLGIGKEHLSALTVPGQTSTCGHQGHIPLGTEQSLDLEVSKECMREGGYSCGAHAQWLFCVLEVPVSSYSYADRKRNLKS